jgi:hypothetical protein
LVDPASATPIAEDKLREAEQHLLEGFHGLEARRASLPRGELLRAAWRLVRFYSDRNNPEEAARWRAELDKLERELPEPPGPEAEV